MTFSMNRRIFLMGVAGAAAGCTRKSTQRLNVYNWSDYVAPDTVANFEREFDVSVRYGTYESSPELLAKVMSGNSGWDVVFPSVEFLQPMRDLSLLAPMQHELIKNLDALDPIFRHPPWDADLGWSIPYMHGTTGIVYRKGIAPEPRAWSDLWDQRLRGKITMLDDPPEVFGACLKKIGDSLNSADPKQLRDAQAQAMAQKPLLRAYLNAEVRDQLVAGDVAAAQAWAVTAGQAIAAAPDKLAYVLPAEGFARYADTMVILRESRRAELAHKFVDYLLRPEVGAAIVKATQTATANAAALKLLPTEFRENPVLDPAPDVLARGEWLEAPTAPSQKLWDRLWTEIKSS
jgi:spermidine/putrescine transport system substrate-binding protein